MKRLLPVNLIHFLDQARLEASSLNFFGNRSQSVSAPPLPLPLLSHFELDSCHLPTSRGEYLIQDHTSLPLATLGPSVGIHQSSYLRPVAICAFTCACYWTLSLLRTKTVPSWPLLSWHKLRHSLKLASKSWTLKSVRPRFEFQFCRPMTAQPWPQSLFYLLSRLNFRNTHYKGPLRRRREEISTA